MKNEPNLFSQDLPKPNSNIQEILFEMITNGNESIKMFWWLPSFRARISDLRIIYNLPITDIESTGKNKFGREYKFMIHKIENQNIEFAKTVYYEIYNNSIKFGKKK